MIATARKILMMRKMAKIMIGNTNTCTFKLTRISSAKCYWRMPELILHRQRLN